MRARWTPVDKRLNTLARRRMHGDDHPDTLTSAGNLANDLANLGEDQAARELDEDTEARTKRLRERDGGG